MYGLSTTYKLISKLPRDNLSALHSMVVAKDNFAMLCCVICELPYRPSCEFNLKSMCL